MADQHNADTDFRTRDLLDSVIGFIVSTVLAIIAFFITVFVVVTGAELADVVADGDFVVLSAALIVAATIIAGGSWRNPVTS